MKKTTKKVFKYAGFAAAGTAIVGVVRHISSKYLMKIAINRQGPKKVDKEKEKMMSCRELSEVMDFVIEEGKKLENLEHERVEITVSDGTVLVGHWFCQGNSKRVLVAMHGWRSGWAQDFGIITPFWQKNDCAVLYAEQRGQGNSGGEYMTFGLLERYDCSEWIKWVNERTEGKLPIYPVGISMGAATVLMTAGFELPDNVRGIVADCAFTCPHAIWKHVVESNYHIPYGFYSRAAKGIYKKRIQVTSDSYSTVDAMKACKIPVLFIHGTDDRFVPIEMTYENYKACNSEKRLLVVPGAEHGMSYLVDKDGYEEAVKSFWNDFDLM